MKTITVKLNDKAEKMFNEIMYSLPENEDGSGICSQSQAVNYALEQVALFEHLSGSDVITWAKENYPVEFKKFNQ